MEQLTIFHVLEQFDPQLAKWENVMNCFEKCTVLAYIPNEAMSSLESSSKYGIGWRDDEVRRKHEIWSDYTTAIWRKLGHGENSWSIACNILKEYRDSHKPCPMQINRSIEFPNRDYFKPGHVVRYLD